METVYAKDGSFTYHTGGVVFGPYGPGECEAEHTTGMKCKHYKGHGGCHGTWDENTVEKFKYRWSNARSA